jgi:hypothetical protein
MLIYKEKLSHSHCKNNRTKTIGKNCWYNITTIVNENINTIDNIIIFVLENIIKGYIVVSNIISKKMKDYK